jgi:hypothetical protein
MREALPKLFGGRRPHGVVTTDAAGELRVTPLADFDGGGGGGGITELTGPVTAGPGSGAQATTITNDAVTDAKLRDSAGLSVIGRGANSTGDPADIVAASNHQVLRRNGTAVSFGAVNLGESAAITGQLPLANIATRTTTLGITIDGGGATITTGIKGDLHIPVACTITLSTLLADQAGAIVIDIWKDTYANFPPTDADSITASAPPTITASGVKAQDATLTGWTVSLAAGDVLRFNVDSCTAIQRVQLQLTVAL